VWVPGGPGLRAFHLQSGKIYSRFVEIVQTLAAGGFFYAPSEADLQNEEIRPLIDRYLRGRASVSAEERIALFKLAWDTTGGSVAQRMAKYVHFYSGVPIRLAAGCYGQYDKASLFELVERALGRREGQPIALSPDNPGSLIPYQPDVRGMAGTYAATSLPEKRDEKKRAGASALSRQGLRQLHALGKHPQETTSALDGLCSCQLQDRACQTTVGRSQLIQDREVVCVYDRNQVT